MRSRQHAPATFARALLAAFLPAVAGCATLPQMLVPAGGLAPAAAKTAEVDPPTAAQVPGWKPAATSMQRPAASSERTLALGNDEFAVTLPCNPTGDKPDRDQTDLGPMRFATFACDDDATKLSYLVLAARFDRALPAAAKDSVRDTKSASVARTVARQACKALKASGATCNVGTPIISGGVASVHVMLGAEDDATTLRVAARYPFAVAVIVEGDGAPQATSRALASIKLPDP